MILRRTDDSITFTVDDVEPVLDPSPSVRRLDAELEETLGGAPLFTSLDSSTSVLMTGSTHALVAAVHFAFANHQPLALSPDDVWLTITQGFARHVANHPTRLRRRLVRHRGRQRLDVRVANPSMTDWAMAVDSWTSRIAETVGEGLRSVMTCDFSTSTDAARIASRIVMMGAFEPFFEYVALCICGIPCVTLEGRPEDWRRMRRRLDVLEEYDLAWWTQRLAPILDAFVETSEGKPDPRFWREIYKPHRTYDEEHVTGWLADLFPYLVGEDGAVDRPNSLMMRTRRVLEHEPSVGAIAQWASLFGPFDGIADAIEPRDAPVSSTIPPGLSEVPFELHGDPDSARYRLFAGLVGATWGADRVTRPLVGWGMRRDVRVEQAP